jgi:TRAP-type C4-dicarboxylate transport system permease small subunit
MAMALLVAAGALICTDVLLRYGFGRPIMGSAEIIEYTWSTSRFSALPGRCRVAPISTSTSRCRRCHPSWQRVCATLSNLVSLCVALVLTVFGALATWSAFARHAFRPSMLEIPLWIVLIIIPIGSALLALRFLRESLVCAEAVVTGRDLQRRETPPPTVD